MPKVVDKVLVLIHLQIVVSLSIGAVVAWPSGRWPRRGSYESYKHPISAATDFIMYLAGGKVGEKMPRDCLKVRYVMQELEIKKKNTKIGIKIWGALNDQTTLDDPRSPTLGLCRYLGNV